MSTLVSVIVPVYNRETLVSQTIDSILSQTYKDFEIIVINDGSTDESLAIIKNYEAQFPNKVRVIDQPNQGQIIARNNGIRVAKGEYIAFLDSDDLWMPRKLERQIPLFEEGVGLVYSGVEIIDEKGSTVRVEPADASITGYIFPQLLVKNRMTGGTVVVTAEALRRVGLFSSDFQAAENWDLWLRICKTYRACTVADPLTKYRIHSSNMSSDAQLMIRAKLQIMEKHSDIGSQDSQIARFSRLAYADYHYRKGINFFSNGDYSFARKEFISVFSFSYKYEDVWMRLFRSFLGRIGNDTLRKIKRI